MELSFFKTKELVYKIKSIDGSIDNAANEKRKLQYEIDLREAKSMVGKCFRSYTNGCYKYLKVIGANKHNVVTESITENGYGFEYDITPFNSPYYLLHEENREGDKIFNSVSVREFEKIKKECFSLVKTNKLIKSWLKRKINDKSTL